MYNLFHNMTCFMRPVTRFYITHCVSLFPQVLPAENAEPNFIVLTFEIFMSRKMVFSSYILTLPCVFLACITLVVFWLPPERPDRTSLGKSILLNCYLFLTKHFNENTRNWTPTELHLALVCRKWISPQDIALLRLSRAVISVFHFQMSILVPFGS